MQHRIIIISILSLVICGLHALSQGSNFDFEKIKIGEAKHIMVGLDLSPNMNTVAISGIQSFPFYLYDYDKQKIIRELDVGNWHAGSAVRYSRNGRYLLLQQLYYADWAPNKDKEVNFEVIEVATGKRIKRFDNYHAIAITADEKFALSLIGEEVAFWNLKTGKKERQFKVNRASNGVAISPNGNYIAVSHHVSEEALKEHTRYSKDKKGAKYIAKYKQQISVYDAQSFEKLYTVDEFYDIVYRLEYSPDGGYLFCQSIPHLKAMSSPTRQTYINTINGITGEPLRKGFTSKATYEPDFKLSHDGKFFGLVSQGSKFMELHIYDFETGKMYKRFELTYRLFEKHEGDFVATDMRTSFVFLPDNQTILMTMGNRLIKWNMESNQQ